MVEEKDKRIFQGSSPEVYQKLSMVILVAFVDFFLF